MRACMIAISIAITSSIAGYLAYHNCDGWGYFVFLAAVLITIL